MKRYFGSLALGAFLLMPLASQAEDRKYYDREHKDYHQWNDNENRAYQRYTEEHKDEKRREFQRENRSHQQDYWKWRHEHSDDVLFPR